MNNCLQCGEPVTRVEGKREKKFCNETCRSNFWYAKNKKGQQKITDLTKPNKEIKPTVQPKTNYSINTRKPFMSEVIKKKLGL